MGHELSDMHWWRAKRWDIADINLQKRVELGTILSLLQTHIDTSERRHAQYQRKSYTWSVARGVAAALRQVQEDLLKMTGEI